ncbi:MAG: zinc-binding dehydrogenase [Prochloraceae cyanobacterium]|nr:zinc-binding dehydrogenase [Prochloraceae cyanobacterium]
MSGAYAEQALCNENQVYHLPANISYKQGAGIYVPYKTAYYSLFHLGKAQLSDTILIHGASGTVGTAALQFARKAGLTAIGTAGNQQGLEAIKKYGASFALNHRETGYLKQVEEITQSHGVDVVLEMAAHANLNKDLQIAAKGGRIIVVGSHGNEASVDPTLIIGQGITMAGVNLFAVSPRLNETIHRAIVTGLEEGYLQPRSSDEFPLKDVVKVHELIASGQNVNRISLIP